MIHQFIFAGPKPGLSAEAFQSYWLNFHAVDFASKIPQIRRYLVAPRVSLPAQGDAPLPDAPFFEGAAEIWLNDDREQIESLQSPEFLEGARSDEPRWAAFWMTFVHDAESVTLHDLETPDAELVKVYVFLKRRPGSTRADFRARLQGDHARLVTALPGLRRHLIGFARDSLYGFGEPRFDAIQVCAFCSPEDAAKALTSAEGRDLRNSWRANADEGQLFQFVGRDHWVIPPGRRDSA